MPCVYWHIVNQLRRLAIEKVPPRLGWLLPGVLCQAFKVWPFIALVKAPCMLRRRGRLDSFSYTHFVVRDTRILPISHRPQSRYSVCSSYGNTQKDGTALHQLRPLTTKHSHRRDRAMPLSASGRSGYMLCLPETHAHDRCYSSLADSCCRRTEGYPLQFHRCWQHFRRVMMVRTETSTPAIQHLFGIAALALLFMRTKMQQTFDYAMTQTGSIADRLVTTAHG